MVTHWHLESLTLGQEWTYWYHDVQVLVHTSISSLASWKACNGHVISCNYCYYMLMEWTRNRNGKHVIPCNYMILHDHYMSCNGKGQHVISCNGHYMNYMTITYKITWKTISIT